MMVLARTMIAIALVSAMATVASGAMKVTTQEATPQKIVFLLTWGNKAATTKEIKDVMRLGAEHCKKFDKVAGETQLSVNLWAPGGVMTVPCLDKNEVKMMERRSAAKKAKTPTLRDKPDKDLCLSLPYGNPDFAKEAERRELTEKKCKEILSQ